MHPFSKYKYKIHAITALVKIASNSPKKLPFLEIWYIWAAQTIMMIKRYFFFFNQKTKNVANFESEHNDVILQ